MVEPLKNHFNETMIRGMARHFKAHCPSFDSDGFCMMASNDLSTLELKQRSEHIAKAMLVYLPNDFVAASKLILASLGSEKEDNGFSSTVDDTGISGWAIMPMSHYVAVQGQEHFDVSMSVLKALTKRFSAEFAVRYFLPRHGEATMLMIKEWTQDENKHVRRLASEGIRPRLPWARQITQFMNDPMPVIEVLERLKDDREAYVRRSVANNLNDIAKDHPNIVADIAEKWMNDASPERLTLLRHACRNLLKQGNKRVLRLFSYDSPNIKKVSFDIHTPVVILGHHLTFSLSLSSNSEKSQPLMIDYVIHHRKAKGQLSAKVFKWRTKNLNAGETLKFTKQHAIKKITTRHYYSGKHVIEVVVNGVVIAQADFQLLDDTDD
ncbi:MAG: DNA alkylation repair protein [Mariprofundaceae bacterium]|nr:DNA alkylation repair protein [Mariprofundaceae bacterium]